MPCLGANITENGSMVVQRSERYETFAFISPGRVQDGGGLSKTPLKNWLGQRLNTECSSGHHYVMWYGANQKEAKIEELPPEELCFFKNDPC